jgi:anaerobic magnesium-protoporphyrin IX monomethyl ester cyclase
MTDLVLVNPRAVNDQYPPLSILTLAAYVRSKGFSVAVVDMQAELLTDEQACSRVQNFNPEFCGLSFMTYQVGYIKTLLPKLKKACPNTVFLAGGVHASILPGEVKDLGFDYVVVGEGELTLVSLLEKQKNINGVYRKEGFDPCVLIPDLDVLPMPAWDLVDVNWYKVSQPESRYKLEAGQALTLSTSRGCFFGCAFCCWSKVFGRTHRFRSASKMVEEIEYLVKTYGIKKFFFVDDGLLGDRKRAEALAELLLSKKLNVIFSAATRVTDDGVNIKTLTLLYKAGLRMLDFGVESGSQKILNDIHKGITVGQIKHAHALAHLAGVHTTSLMMVGHLEETWSDFLDSLALFADVDTEYVNWNPLTPFPGTEVHEKAKAQGWIRDFDWSNYLVDGFYRVSRSKYFDYGEANGLEQLAIGVTDVMMKWHKNKPGSYFEFYQLLASNYPLGLNAKGRLLIIKFLQTGKREYLEKLSFKMLKLSKNRHLMEHADDAKLIISVRKHPVKLITENNRVKRLKLFAPLAIEYVYDTMKDYFSRIVYAWRLTYLK